jgi:hypothetical protein
MRRIRIATPERLENSDRGYPVSRQKTDFSIREIADAAGDFHLSGLGETREQGRRRFADAAAPRFAWPNTKTRGVHFQLYCLRMPGRTIYLPPTPSHFDG